MSYSKKEKITKRRKFNGIYMRKVKAKGVNNLMNLDIFGCQPYCFLKWTPRR